MIWITSQKKKKFHRVVYITYKHPTIYTKASIFIKWINYMLEITIDVRIVRIRFNASNSI